MRDIWVKRAAALLTGGILGVWAPVGTEVWFFGGLILLGLRGWSWRPSDFFGLLWRQEILLLGATVLVGYFYGVTGDRQLAEPIRVEGVEVRGVLLDWKVVDERGSGVFEISDWSGGKVSGPAKLDTELPSDLAGEKYRLLVYPGSDGVLPVDWAQVRAGDSLAVRVNLERPPGSGTEGGFDRRLYDNVRGLSGTLTAKGSISVLEMGTPSVVWLIRNHVTEYLKAWDVAETGVLEGILFGDSSRIPAEVEEDYRVTGVLHVFAASGSNVAFVAALFWALLRYCPRTWRVVGTSGALLFYAALCGGNAPITRATILGIAALLGSLGQGRFSSLRWLFFAAAGLFVVNPLILTDVGFQLSFAAAWGIIVLAPRLALLPILGKVPKGLRQIIAVTWAAQIVTLPILIEAFHRISIIGLLVNLFILVILGTVLELGLVAVLLSFSFTLSAPLFQVCLWLLVATDQTLAYLASLSWADVWVLRPGWGFWLLWYGAIAVSLTGRAKVMYRLRVLWQGLGMPDMYAKMRAVPVIKWGVVVLLSALVIWAPWQGRGELKVDFIDVGQGDAILIRTPQQHAILIDAGSKTENYDAGERVVIPYLLENRVKELDALVVTHEHQDHSGGVESVLANIPTEWVGVPQVEERLSLPEWDIVVDALGEEPERLKILAAGDRIELDSGAWLEVLAPQEVLKGTHSDANNNSLVLKLHYAGQSVLLTGDMEREEMQAISAAGQDWDVDFYKVPHHGSRFSNEEELLDSFSPQAVFISVGKNSFDHPSQEVINYWEERQIPVYRTDVDGTVRLVLDKGGAEVITGRPR